MLANTLAKVSYGFADNLLTSVIRAWYTSPMNPKRAVIIVALAMNSCVGSPYYNETYAYERKNGVLKETPTRDGSKYCGHRRKHWRVETSGKVVCALGVVVIEHRLYLTALTLEGSWIIL